MSGWRPPRFGAVLLAATLGAVLLAACGNGGSGPGPDRHPCAGRNTVVPAGPVKGATVLLLDRTRSAQGAGAPDWAAAAKTEIRSAVARGDVVSVAGFDGSSAALVWSTVVTAYDGDDTARTFDQSASRACLAADVTAAARSVPRVAGTDVLGAMADAAQLLDRAPAGHRRLLVATDGLVNVGCASLLDASFLGSQAPVVRGCRDVAGVPNLSGTDVTLTGIGHAASGQPIPSSGQLTWLTELWRQFCAAAGAATCTVGSLLTAANGDGTPPVGGAADEPVVFPAVSAPRPDGGRLVVTLDDRLLFARNSDQLSPDAGPVLDNVVGTVRGVHGTVVEVIGHTDSTGTDQYNQLLSKGRADTVGDALGRRGYPVAQRTGDAARDPSPTCGPEHFPDGSNNEAAMRCDRRVEVVIAVPAEGS